jgi:hypothetical protein
MEAAMNEIARSLAALGLGTPQVRRNLAFFPLLGDSDAPRDYLFLDEALERGLARVSEVSEAGRVPELAFENHSAEKILLVDGDELVGAKQNRIVNLSILVGAGKRVAIPVSCVEQGRWSWRTREFRASEAMLFARARARKMARVSESLRSRGGREADQHEVWDSIAEKAEKLKVASRTSAMSDVYESYAQALERYEKAFRAQPRQRGAVVALDGRVVGVELFDSPAAFARCLAKLVRSYALDAVETAERSEERVPCGADVERFLESVAGAEASRHAALGEGEDVRLSADGLAGGALVADGRVVHLAAQAL